MDSDNWVVSNLQGALDTWNEKMGEIVGLLTASPADFRGGGIWDAVLSIHGAVQAVALALLVLFFLSGLVKTCGSFAEAKRPEVVLKLFVRFVLAHAAVVYGLELMMAFLDVVQGLIGDMMDTVGFASAAPAALPGEMVEAIEDVGFLDAIPLWAVTLLGGLLVTVLSFIMILAVYGRFFKIYMYTALAPIPLSTFAGEPSQSVGKAWNDQCEQQLYDGYRCNERLKTFDLTGCANTQSCSSSKSRPFNSRSYEKRAKHQP